MAGVAVKVTEETRETLRGLAEAEHRSMQDVLAQAVEWYRRKRMLEETNEAYAVLRGDDRSWGEMQEERFAWDGTLEDGFA